MPNPRFQSSVIPKSTAVAIASAAFVVPLTLSLSSTPSPNHPRTMGWYLSLKQPNFKPPDWSFPLAWTGIEAGLAVAAYRILRAPAQARSRTAMALWTWNVFTIGAWSRVFFKRRELAASTLVAASLVATSAAFVKQAEPIDRTAARAALPLVAWAAFATVLTATIWHLNARDR